jgi:transcriptional regulator with XRE-family HTH domain
MKKNLIFMNLLRRKDLTQEQFAELVEFAWRGISGRPLSRQAVSAWVNGRSIPKLSPAETLVVLEILGCTLTEFALAFPHEHTESGVLTK